MAEALDWTRVSDDPNNPAAQRLIKQGLLERRRIDMDTNLVGYVVRACENKRVLDVGIAEHAARYVDQPGWRHAKIAKSASYCLGIDVLEPLVHELCERGYNVRAVDATSEVDLGERFDVVFIGDVVEHVDNPVALLRFGARHLTPHGKLLVATPNAFSRKFVRRFRRERIALVNLDHVRWVTPTMALELGRRAGLALSAYHLIKPVARWKQRLKRVAWRFTPPDYTFPDYLYEFRRLAADVGATH